MRVKLYLIFLLFIPGIYLNAQEPIEKFKIEKESEATAEFPGGMIEFGRFISKNITLTGEIDSFGCQTIYVKFTIESDGSVSNANILKGASGCPQCDEEVLRVIKLMPKWNPAKIQGKVVSTTWTIPIRIKLN